MGRIFKFDKDVDTDQIIASQYLLFPTIDEMITLDVVHQESRHQAYLRH